MGWLLRAALLPPILYVALLAALAFEPIQRHALYANFINIPGPVSYLKHETIFGFAQGSIRHLNVSTPDGVYLGGWQVLPRDVYDAEVAKHGYASPITDKVFDEALKKAPVVLYAHGNAANRATGHRRHVARAVTTANFNFVIWDYRGFGDSGPASFAPSEAGLVIDAKAMWDWLTVEKRVKASEITLMGQSLGTGVMSALAGRVLAPAGVSPRAVVLIAAYSSIPKLLETYKLGKVIPLLGPLVKVPGAHKLLLRFLRTRFDSKTALLSVKAPIVVVHALNDDQIGHTHSEELFNSLAAQDGVKPKTKELGDHVGRIRVAGRLLHMEPAYGGHNSVGYSETAQHYIRQIVRHGKLATIDMP